MIRKVQAEDVPKVVDLIVIVNAADPFVRWMYPDPHQYLSSLPETIMRFGGKAFDQGTAYYVDAFLGVALWLEPGVHPDEDALGSHLTNTLSTSIQDEVFAVFKQMDSCHPSSLHWYLPLLAVDPFHQNKGIGTALLEDAIKRFDDEGITSYLESSNPRNISLYKRHGFEVVTEIQAGPTLVTPMVRKPQ